MLDPKPGYVGFSGLGGQSLEPKNGPAALCDIQLDERLWFFSFEHTGPFGFGQAPHGPFLSIIVSNLIFWLLYVYGRRGQDFKARAKFLRRPLLLAAIAVFGHLVPVAHLSLMASTEMVGLSSAVLVSITGLVLVGRVSAQKAGIIMAAGSFRSLVLHADQGR